MSERERWIVYPLLFFALGSALRDKLLQRIESKEIYCESLKIVDPENPTRLLAELGSGKEIPYDSSQTGGRVGVLTIQDSDGKEACQLAKDLRLSRVITNLLLVVDPVNQQPLVIAGTEQVPTISVGGTNTVAGAAPFGLTGSTVSHHGVLMLNNQRVIPIRPPMQPRRSAPSPPSSSKAPAPPSEAPAPPSEAPAPPSEAPAKDPKSNDAAVE
jgi:hypothetical protein